MLSTIVSPFPAPHRPVLDSRPQRIRHLWLANMLASSRVTPSGLRVRLLRKAGVRIGSKVFIAAGTQFLDPDIEIGDECFIGRGCEFESGVRLHGRNDIGPGARLLTITHEIGPPARRAGPVVVRQVIVEHGTWIGALSMVLPGVRIGRSCVIAAGSVVNEDCEPDGLYAGVPARRKRDLGHDQPADATAETS